jgi:hypothetical protein
MSLYIIEPRPSRTLPSHHTDSANSVPFKYNDFNLIYIFLIRILKGGVQTASTRHVGHFWPIVSAPRDYENGGFGGMKISRGNRSTRRKPSPAPLYAPEVTLDQTWARTRAAAVRSHRLTASAMARPSTSYNHPL